MEGLNGLMLMDLTLEHLDAEQLQAISGLWGAPSAQPQPLARYLSAPLQIHRRIENLSAHGRDELVALLEATTPEVPFETLRQSAIEELAAMILVQVSPIEPLMVTLPLAVARAALEVLDATPCQLRLLLHRLTGAHLEELHARVCPGATHAPMPEAIATALTCPETLGGLVEGLEAQSRDALWELVASGGLMPRREAEEAVAADRHGLRPLVDMGLLWFTAKDARIAVEVLRALLLLRLRRTVHRAAARCAALHRQPPQDNVLAFPTPRGRWLAQAADLLGRVSAGTTLGPDELPALLDADPGPALERRLNLTLAAGLLERRGKELAVGSLTCGGLSRLPSAGLAETVMRRLVERVAMGEPWSGVEEATRRILSTDHASEEDFADDHGAEAAICAVAPHLMDPGEAACFPVGAWHGAQRLLRALLQQLLAGFEVGQSIALADLEPAVSSLAEVARAHQRLVGCAYARDPHEPPPEQRRQATRAWLEALAIPLGWLRPDEEPHEEAHEPPRVDALPLFEHLDHGARPKAPAPARLDPLRVVTRAPSVTPEVADLLDLSNQHLAALAPLWAEVHALSLVEGLEDFHAPRPALDTLREQLTAFCEVARDGEQEVAELLRDFVLGQTAARRLQDIRPEDLERFLVCWVRVVSSGSLARIRLIFSGLEHLAAWARAQDIGLPVDVMALRARLEGRLLRTSSAEAAFRAHQRRAAPPDLLRLRPEPGFDGLSEIIQLAPGQRTMRVRPLQGPQTPLTVRTAPEPLRLLQPGDLIDAQLVRYGEVCWLNQLRRVLVSEAARCQ